MTTPYRIAALFGDPGLTIFFLSFECLSFFPHALTTETAFLLGMYGCVLKKKKKQSKGATRHGDGSVCPASELGSQEAKEGQPRDGTSGGGVGARFSRYTVVPLDFQGAKSRRKSHQEVGYRRKASFPR